MAGNDLEERVISPRHTAARPLLAPAARPLAAAVVAGCVIVTALLGAVLAHRTQADWLDTAVDGRLQASFGGHRALLNRVALLGSGIGVTAVTVALVAACLATHRWRGALLLAIAVPAAEGVTELLLKPLIGRPLHGYSSFPSGHTTGAFAVAAAVAVLLTGPGRPRLPVPVRLLLLSAAFVAASATALAMVGMGAHYFTDTVGGAAVGIAMVLATALALDKLLPPDGQRKSVSAPSFSAASSSRRRVWR